MDFEKNYELKQGLVDRLRDLINNNKSISKNYSEFRSIKEKWFQIGPVSNQKNEILWNNFQHHIKNFYDYLRIDKTLKKIDDEYNIKKKEKIIDQARKLALSDNLLVAEKLIKKLKKRWRFDTGPIYKEDLGLKKEFQRIQSTIEQKIKVYKKNREDTYKENLRVKMSYLNKFKEILAQESLSINEWKNKIDEIEILREKIQISGPLGKKHSKKFWGEFKKYNKKFYSSKNIFFKERKKLYKINITKQEKLISELWKLIKEKKIEAKKIKTLQQKWKLIKPIPQKINKKNYQIFKQLCDEVFEIIRNKNKELNKKTIEELKLQADYIKKTEIHINEGNIDLNKVISGWNSFSKTEKELEKRFLTMLEMYLKKQNLDQKEIDNKIFDLKTNRMSDSEKKVEKKDLKKELDLTRKQLYTFENNISFFNNKTKQKNIFEDVSKDLDSIRYKIKMLEHKIIKLTK